MGKGGIKGCRPFSGFRWVGIHQLVNELIWLFEVFPHGPYSPLN
jgi:hypothetical protein